MKNTNINRLDRHAYLASFPELNPNPVCEVSLSGNIEYLNPAIKQLFPDLQVCGEKHAYLADFKSIADRFRSSGNKSFMRELKVGDRYYEQSMYYVVPTQTVRIYGIDVSGKNKSEYKLLKVNRTLRALSDSNQAMMRATDELEYLKKACEIIVKDCGYSMVWIGYAEQNESKSVRPVAQAGFEAGYLNALNVTWADTERGRGPTGTAIRTGKPRICKNMLTDPNFRPWREEAIIRGYASSVVLPMIAADKVFGAISIYSKEADPFSKDEVRLLAELADDLAYGIIVLRIRVANKQAEEILKRDKETLESLVKERSRELMEAHVALDRAKRLSDIGALAAIVAHELRNPLGVIRTAAYNIKTKRISKALDKHIDRIEKKVVDANQIINNLLFYSRIKEPNYEKIEIYNILKEAISEVKNRFKDKKIIVKEKLRNIKDAAIEADPVQIREVINNILNNAFEATDDRKGEIEVAAVFNKEKDVMSISFKDNGTGINQEDIERIHEPFFTTKAKGTGLGLSVCYQIVNLHGGDITIESKVGTGTKFTVTLPSKRKIQASK